MNIKLPPSHPVATDTIAFPTQTSSPPLTMPYNVAASSKTPDITSAFFDQMKELKFTNDTDATNSKLSAK